MSALPCPKGNYPGNLGQAGQGAGQGMRHTQFSLVISSFKTGIVVVGLCFQMLPFLLLLVVMAHTLGVSGGVLLVIFPVFF